MSRAPLAHSLGLQDEPLGLRVHDVQRRLPVVKSVGKRFVNGVVDILGVESSNFTAIPLDGALNGIGPGSHVIQIRLGNRQIHDGSAGGEIQIFSGEGLPGVGYALRLSGEDQGQLRHRLVFLVSQDVVLRVFGPGDLLGN